MNNNNNLKSSTLTIDKRR